MSTLAINGRYLQQDVTGVQRYARETTAALQTLLGSEQVCTLMPTSANPLRARLWEWWQLASAAREATGSKATLNLCNWGPIDGLDEATVVVADAAVHEHPEGFVRPYRALAKSWMLLLRHSRARVVTVSSRSQKALEQLLGKPVPIAPCGVDVEAAGVASQRGRAVLARHGLDDHPFVLLVGGHDARKNVAFALSLLPDLRARGLRIVVTYRPGIGSLGKVVPPSSSSGGAHWIAAPDDDELWSLYSRATALLHPSKYEGFGLPLLEAAAVGTPFLSAPVGAAEELSVDARQVLGLTVTSWAQALDVLLRERAAWSAASVDKARTFNWNATAAALADAVAR